MCFSQVTVCMLPTSAPVRSCSSDADAGHPSDTSPKGFFKVPAALVAALILVARNLCPGWKWWPKTATILKLLGAGKSQTYAYVETVRAHLPAMVGKPGRPRPSVSNQCTLEAVRIAVNAFLRAHPGAVCENGSRCVYSDGWRRFVVGLLDAGQPGHGMSIADLAVATGVRLGTLKTWLRSESEDNPKVIDPPPQPTLPSAQSDTKAAKDDDSAVEQAPPAARLSSGTTDKVPSIVDSIRDAHQRLILTEWPTWKGSFKGFCHMLRTEHRLQHGDTYIGSFLQAVGARTRTRRRPTEAPWSSGTYRTFYPGAHWVGDGHEASIHWHPTQVFVFNIEGIHDPAADAVMGFAVTDTEDEEALRVAYQEALKTSVGQPPEALTLDNKPSNHSTGAVAATPGTTLLRSTPGRGQSKAPVEGLWGLFQQAMGPLVVDGDTPREKARSVLRLVFEAWCRGRNGKPRKKLKEKTPAETYMQARPTPEEVERARAWIADQKRRQDKFQETREARQDPVRLHMLHSGLAELGIPDPEGRLAVALACYSIDAMGRGLSTLKAKQTCGSVPPDADLGRYLGGIIRNLHTRLEANDVSQDLFERRLKLGDVTLAPLQCALEDLQDLAPAEKAKTCVDRALNAKWEVDVRFWTQAATEALVTVPVVDQRSLYDTLSRRISASFRTDRDRRIDIIDRLAIAATASIAASTRAISGDSLTVTSVVTPMAVSAPAPIDAKPLSQAGLAALAATALPRSVAGDAGLPVINMRDSRHGCTTLSEASAPQTPSGRAFQSRSVVDPAGRAPSITDSG